jgi:protein-L-isoaspartate(D-aspartate) O-methyltransferase
MPAQGDPREAEARRRRRAMVEEVAERDPGLDPRVLDALERVPRHAFLPDVPLATAYANHAYPIGYGQTISQPTVVAVMSDALELEGDERVLEIGTGSGYQAAVLACLAREVWSVEVVAALAEAARRRLAALGYDNVHVREADGTLGYPAQAPFDRIVLTAAPERLPDALALQLVEGGILVAPVGTADQRLARWRKRDGRLEHDRDLGGVRFVPLV